MNIKRITTAFTLVSVMLFTASCGGPSPAILKSAVAAFKPFIAYEIEQGHITQANADKYTNDADALIGTFDGLTIAWAAAKTNADKAAAISTFVNTVAPIVNDFAKLPQLNTALLIFNTALAVVQAFYGGVPSAAALAPGASMTQMPKTEKELKNYLDVQGKLLKAALAH